MPKRHLLLTQTDKDGDPYTVYEAGMGTHGPPRGVPWWSCPTCGQAYPQDRMEKIGGAWFSTENGCADEERDRLEKAERSYGGHSYGSEIS